MVNYWVWSVDEDNWKIVKKDDVWGTYSKTATEKVKLGDEIIFYVIDKGVFSGVYKIVSEWYETKELRWADEFEEKKKIYPYEVKLKPVKLGEVDVRRLKNELSFLNVQYWMLRLRGIHGLPANNANPINEKDYNLIISEMKPIEKTPEIIKPKEITKRPTHDEIKLMLKDIGEILGFYVKDEEYTPDSIYRCDVTWRDEEDHAPMKVFEVELSGNIDHALASLTHAFDTWRSAELYLIVEDESDELRVDKLVGPRIKGAFARIKRRLTVWPWTYINELYKAIHAHKEPLKKLASRELS